MTDYKILLNDYSLRLLKALAHLEYSFQKVQNLSFHVAELDDEQLEAWEGFVSRFSRASDLFVTKYLKSYILNEDPAFDGTLRDSLNRAEKYRLIEDTQIWLEIRSLRNAVAHDYDEGRLEKNLKRIRELAPIVLKIKNVLK